MLKQYNKQKSNAKSRNIEWLISYDEWLNWWKSTGHINERGRLPDQYCMCRIGDEGPYSLSNIYCATSRQNVKDAAINGKCVYTFPTFKGKHHSAESRKKISDNNASKLSDEEINRRKDIYDSGDFSSRGGLQRYSRAIGISHTRARKFLLSIGYR